ncbi:hypothetical protein F5050DRAFT_623811 [Lentinula boryana]|uniref:Uncharacterized protein n=1 Tax=Lentinula boryana TaxID=40481 RepID=A0ABQ8QP53_9AGAR|nr:hypothetical protein F5050DRAFT_623811 [Lentinula boryana]
MSRELFSFVSLSLSFSLWALLGTILLDKVAAIPIHKHQPNDLWLLRFENELLVPLQNIELHKGEQWKLCLGNDCFGAQDKSGGGMVHVWESAPTNIVTYEDLGLGTVNIPIGQRDEVLGNLVEPDRKLNNNREYIGWMGDHLFALGFMASQTHEKLKSRCRDMENIGGTAGAGTLE